MHATPTRILAGLAASLLIAAPAVADDSPSYGQHRSPDELLSPGRIPAGAASPMVTDNFEVVGHTNLGGGTPNGDVFLYDHPGVGLHAYIGTWSGQCTGQGAKIVDVSDPTRPRWLGYVGARPDSSNEDVTVVRIGSRDVLGIGVQSCGRRGSAGLALFDVTNPSRPSALSFFSTPFGVHELDMVVRGDGTALALLALPFQEAPYYFSGGAEDLGGEFWIVDISDPTDPQFAGDWGLLHDGGPDGLLIQQGNDPVTSIFQGLGLFPVHFDHSARAADGGTTAYVSNWDAGVLKLDISDPSSPELLGRTVFPVTADGDAHSMTPFDVGGTRYILQNDEDFDAGPSTVLVTSSATGSAEYQGIQEFWAPILPVEIAVSGTVHDAGDGCDAGDYAGAAGRIALADSIDPFYPDLFGPAPCAIGTQATLAAQAGATAFVSNLVSVDDAYGYGPDAPINLGSMPAIQVSDIDELVDAIRAAASPVTLSLTLNRPSWGFLRVFEENDDPAIADYQQVGSFTGPALDTGAPGFPAGFWSVHNTEVLGDRAYSSWYTAGVIAVDMSDPTEPKQVGQFVPPTSRRHANSLGPGPAAVWAVAIDADTGLIYAGDMRTGLWIIRPTGQAAPSD